MKREEDEEESQTRLSHHVNEINISRFVYISHIYIYVYVYTYEMTFFSQRFVFFLFFCKIKQIDRYEEITTTKCECI